MNPTTPSRQRITLAPKRLFHSVLTAEALAAAGFAVRIRSGAPRRFFAALDPGVTHHLAPLPAAQLARVLPLGYGPHTEAIDAALYDAAVAARLRGDQPVALIGYAGSALISGRRIKALGGRFVLDRACPTVATQQALLAAEADRHGYRFAPQPAWYVARQEAEYAAADVILTPSHYTADSFPAALRDKVVIAPLLGRVSALTPADPAPAREAGGEFVLGIVGGQPIRKGYAYLLDAWARLALPRARLRIRSDAVADEPALRRWLGAPGIELVGYQRDMAAFYRGCDAFILPSVDDGFGMAAFEAAAHGVPLIISRQCGASELFTPGVSAEVIAAGSTQTIAAAIERFYREPAYRAALGAAGAARVAALAQAGLYASALLGALAGLGLGPA